MKKNIALGLSIIIGSTSVLPAYANNPKLYFDEVEEFVSENTNSKDKELLYDDINLINEYFYNEEYLTDITLSNNNYIYTYTVLLDSGNVVTADIEINTNRNGDIEFYIKEDDVENTLVFTKENQILLDGTEIKVEEITMPKEINNAKAQPYALGSVYYDSEPFWGTPRDYSDFQGTKKYKVATDYIIKGASITALSAVIGSMVAPAGVVFSVLTIASALIDAYKSNNATGETLFYTQSTWESPYAPSITETLTSYYKYQLKWFTDSLYSNEVTSIRETGYTKTVLRSDV